MTQLLAREEIGLRPPAARAAGLTKRYRRGAEEVRALDGVDLTLERGEFAAIIGPSGSGKSTLLNLLGCMDRPSAGRLWIAGEEVAGLGDAALTRMRRAHIGFIFQQFHLLPTLTVLENVLLPATFGGGKGINTEARRHGGNGTESLRGHQGGNPARHRNAVWSALPVPFENLHALVSPCLRVSVLNTHSLHLERARELLERVGLGGRLRHLPSQLSGGEMQRVAIARSLINAPELLLADEPTGNLDSEASARVLEIFRELHADDLTVLLVTHNAELAAGTRRLIRLRDGRIAEDTRL